MSRIGTIPISSAKATTRSTTSGSVRGVPITSAVFCAQMWFAKCRARNRSGRPVASAMALGSSVDEFVANTVVSGAAAAIEA